MVSFMYKARARGKDADVHLDLRNQVVQEAEQMQDDTLYKIATAVVKKNKEAAAHAEKLAKPYYLLRLTIISLCFAVVGGVFWTAWAFNLRLNLNTWIELLDLGAKSCQMLIAFPLILSVLLLESRLRRDKILKAIGELEQLNDRVYEAQFQKNAHSATDRAELLRYLDCCCGLLFLIRVSCGAYAHDSNDRVVLERIGNIRRGSNDNHRNVLMKIAMAMNSQELATA